MTRDHEVIYIFHDHIDNVGDKNKAEAKALDAVEQAFDELEQIIKKVANINGNNMLLTADHGFLFQQTEVDDSDMTPLPPSVEWTFHNRRFAIGLGIAAGPTVNNAYSPGWEVAPIRHELFTSGYGFVVDYIAEVLKRLRDEDFTGSYKAHNEISEILIREAPGSVDRRLARLPCDLRIGRPQEQARALLGEPYDSHLGHR